MIRIFVQTDNLLPLEKASEAKAKLSVGVRIRITARFFERINLQRLMLFLF
jgi:hypothetical protein